MTDETLIALLEELRDGQREILGLLRAWPPRAAPPPNAANLINAIVRTFGDKAFTVSDLYAEDAPDLRAALGQMDSRQIGKLLSRIKGHAIDGLSVHRVGSSREGTVWHLVRV